MRVGVGRGDMLLGRRGGRGLAGREGAGELAGPTKTRTGGNGRAKGKEGDFRLFLTRIEESEGRSFPIHTMQWGWVE